MPLNGLAVCVFATLPPILFILNTIGNASLLKHNSDCSSAKTLQWIPSLWVKAQVLTKACSGSWATPPALSWLSPLLGALFPMTLLVHSLLYFRTFLKHHFLVKTSSNPSLKWQYCYPSLILLFLFCFSPQRLSLSDILHIFLFIKLLLFIVHLLLCVCACMCIYFSKYQEQCWAVSKYLLNECWTTEPIQTNNCSCEIAMGKNVKRREFNCEPILGTEGQVHSHPGPHSWAGT